MIRVCDVPGCGRPHRASGLCALHYRRRRLTGQVGPAEVLRWDPETLLADVDWMLSTGAPIVEICARTDITPAGVEQAARRHGRPDLARLFGAEASRQRRAS